MFTKRRYGDGKGRLSRYFIRMNGRTRFYAISEYVKSIGSSTLVLRPSTRAVYNGVPNDAFNAEAERDAVRKS